MALADNRKDKAMNGFLELSNLSCQHNEQVAIEIKGEQFVIDPGYSHCLPMDAGHEYNIRVTALRGRTPKPVFTKDGEQVFPHLSIEWCNSRGEVVSPVNIAEQE